MTCNNETNYEVLNTSAIFHNANEDLRENVKIAEDIVAGSRFHNMRYVYYTRHGWGSCSGINHMPPGTFYLEVIYQKETHLTDVKRSPLPEASEGKGE